MVSLKDAIATYTNLPHFASLVHDALVGTHDGHFAASQWKTCCSRFASPRPCRVVERDKSRLCAAIHLQAPQNLQLSALSFPSAHASTRDGLCLPIGTMSSCNPDCLQIRHLGYGFSKRCVWQRARCPAHRMYRFIKPLHRSHPHFPCHVALPRPSCLT